MTLTANVQPTASDIGQTAGVYIMATYQGQIYALVSNNGNPNYNFDVVRISDNKLPPFTSEILGSSVNIELMLGYPAPLPWPGNLGRLWHQLRRHDQ